MKRRILTYGGYFEAFMSTLKEKEQQKIQYGLLLLKTPAKPKGGGQVYRSGKKGAFGAEADQKAQGGNACAHGKAGAAPGGQGEAQKGAV